MNSELEQKTQRLIEMLEREDLDAVLLNAQHNFAWLTGGGSNGVDMSRENGVASLIVTRQGKRFLLSSVIELRRMYAEELSEDDFEPIEFSWQDDKANPLSPIERAKTFFLDAGNRLASDLPINASVPVIESKIAYCRYQLTSDEVVRIRQLGSDAAAVVQQVAQTISPGLTEKDIAEQLRHELALGGMTSVVTLVAADERVSQFRHPVPTAKSWRNTALIVTCAKRSGLIVSLSRMISSGPVPDELQRRTAACANVNAHILNATRPGNTGSEMYAAAAKAYAKVGFGEEINLHHQGGAAGYRTREWVAHPQSSEVVRSDQAFAWNPSITGTKVEDTVIATESGVEIITPTPDFPSIVTDLDGREYRSPGILTV
jgi:antitoxin VapB